MEQPGGRRKLENRHRHALAYVNFSFLTWPLEAPGNLRFAEAGARPVWLP